MKEKYAVRLPRVIIGFLTSMAGGILLTWSYFREPLMQTFPSWTTSDLSLIFSVHNIFVSLTMVVAGMVLKKLPTRVSFLIAALCFGVALCGFRFLPVDNPKLAYIIAFIFYAILAPIGCGITCLLAYSIYPAWYPEKSGFVNGLMITAFNICPIFAGALASVLLKNNNILTTMGVIGAVVFVFVALSIPVGVYPTEKDHLPPRPVRSENTSGREFSTKEMLKSGSFWCIFFFHTFLFAVGLILADHAAGIAVSFGAAALFGLLFAPAKGVSCLGVGWLMDKLSTTGAMYVLDFIVIGAAALLIVAANMGSMILVLVGLILLGLGIGGCSSVKSVGIRFFFGSENFQQNFGVTNANILPAALIVFIASKIIEAMSGSYYGVFIIFLVLGVLALLCTAYLQILMKKMNKHQAVEN